MNRRHLLGSAGALGFASLSVRTTLAQDDHEAANIETVRRFFDEFRVSRDAEMARELVADDYVSQDPDSAPGIDAYVARSKSYYERLSSRFISYEWFSDAINAQDNSVVWRGREKGATTDGKLIEAYFLYWFDLNDESKISTFWIGIDPIKALDFWII